MYVVTVFVSKLYSQVSFIVLHVTRQSCLGEPRVIITSKLQGLHSLIQSHFASSPWGHVYSSSGMVFFHDRAIPLDWFSSLPNAYGTSKRLVRYTCMDSHYYSMACFPVHYNTASQHTNPQHAR